MPYDDAFKVTKNWVNSCDKIKPLDFNANVKIKDTLRAATRVGYLPMGFSDLKSENGELYRHILNRFGNASSKLKDSLEITDDLRPRLSYATTISVNKFEDKVYYD